MKGLFSPLSTLYFSFDSTKDGSIHPKQIMHYFTQLDTNSDDMVSRAEFNFSVGPSLLEFCY